jgi:hypothetical protein
MWAIDEIVWIKQRTDIGLEEIKNAVFTPDNLSIVVTDGLLKTVELDPATGNVKREIKNIAGIFKFSDDTQFVFTYDNELPRSKLRGIK